MCDWMQFRNPPTSIQTNTAPLDFRGPVHRKDILLSIVMDVSCHIENETAQATPSHTYWNLRALPETQVSEAFPSGTSGAASSF